MRLEFIERSVYGNTLYYPVNEAAQAIVKVTGRKCFKIGELQTLSKVSQFEIVATVRTAMCGGYSIRSETIKD